MKLPGPSPSLLIKLARNRIPFPLRAPTVPDGMEIPEPENRTGIDFDTEWARRTPARLARRALTYSIVGPGMKLIASPTVLGRDRLKNHEGALVFAANHHSHADTPLLISSIPEPWRSELSVAAAADYFFANRITGAVSALALNAIPLERQRISRKSSDQAAGLLEDGWSLLIYPEGGRSPDGWAQAFRAGAAYLSLRTGTAVAPIHVEGTSRIMAKGKNWPRRARTTITFGMPMRPLPDEDSKAFGARIEAAVAALADESSTDWWTARKRAHAGSSPSLTGPDASAWRRTWMLGETTTGRRRSRRNWPDI
ncbi:MAG: 1-acyl-sn-glycerol-3-phosphate acyltransferase [Actinomycetia bacterium]|nr:1-acyl-sn-glycerol-3-phosphate acyltransferase [Actinomycetes bacterium]MCP4087893.1 1-acyl-sn-glycerol-3-phosphate acyltransferase [Actinomycetes bacterium]